MKRILLILSLLLITTGIFSYDTITLNDLVIGSGVFKAINTEIYKRMGIEVKFKVTPLERALYLSNACITDGEMGRTQGILFEFENLRMVPTPIMDLKIHVYTKDENNIIKDLDNLSEYSIGILKGIKSVEEITRGMDVYTANSAADLFKILEKGRVDIVITADIFPKSVIENLEIDNIIKIEPQIFKLKLYHMLNKKHEVLIPQLDKVINEMIDDGTMQKIIDSFES